MRYRYVVLTLLTFAVTKAPAESKYPPMPEAFSSFGAAVADGYVYVYGGHIGKTHTYSTEAVTNKFRRLNLADPSRGWEELAPGPKMQGLALVAHQGKIYRMGGMQPRNKPGDKADSYSLATCSVFDPKSMQWHPMPDLPAGRSSHDATVVGDTIVVVGGWNMNGAGKPADWHDTTLLLDLSQKSPEWKSIKQPFQRRALNVAAHDGKVYAVCGMASNNKVEKTVNVLDLKTQTWQSGPKLPGQDLNGFTPAVCMNGGNVYASPSDGSVYRLSPKGDAWEEVAVLSQKRLVHRIVPLGDNKLLVLGGASRGAGNLALVEAIEPGRATGATKTTTPQ